MSRRPPPPTARTVPVNRPANLPIATPPRPTRDHAPPTGLTQSPLQQKQQQHRPVNVVAQPGVHTNGHVHPPPATVSNGHPTPQAAAVGGTPGTVVAQAPAPRPAGGCCGGGGGGAKTAAAAVPPQVKLAGFDVDDQPGAVPLRRMYVLSSPQSVRAFFENGQGLEPPAYRILMLHADWCGWCKKFKPVYRQWPAYLGASIGDVGGPEDVLFGEIEGNFLPNLSTAAPAVVSAYVKQKKEDPDVKQRMGFPSLLIMRGDNHQIVEFVGGAIMDPVDFWARLEVKVPGILDLKGLDQLNYLRADVRQRIQAQADARQKMMLQHQQQQQQQLNAGRAGGGSAGTTPVPTSGPQTTSPPQPSMPSHQRPNPVNSTQQPTAQQPRPLAQQPPAPPVHEPARHGGSRAGNPNAPQVTLRYDPKRTNDQMYTAVSNLADSLEQAGKLRIMRQPVPDARDHTSIIVEHRVAGMSHNGEQYNEKRSDTYMRAAAVQYLNAIASGDTRKIPATSTSDQSQRRDYRASETSRSERHHRRNRTVSPPRRGGSPSPSPHQQDTASPRTERRSSRRPRDDNGDSRRHRRSHH